MVELLDHISDREAARIAAKWFTRTAQNDDLPLEVQEAASALEDRAWALYDLFEVES